ncbi:hypothetical protein EYF80_021035 [Liparis tanakae]|uniref:Uncharacterized protein n=1 Tax=Liparis tanakae TaxID=230148 RepID=A0A4Z2HUT8_9TELE|nr:hypothetical protein EYF80_021035 [Liparis tanakae]
MKQRAEMRGAREREELEERKTRRRKRLEDEETAELPKCCVPSPRLTEAQVSDFLLFRNT